MDLNTYATEKIAEQRLAELRAVTARMASIASAGSPRRGPASALGAALIRAGQWLASTEAPVRVAR